MEAVAALPSMDPDESVTCAYARVSVHVDGASAPPGTLHVTTRRLVWLPDDGAGSGGWSIAFPSIGMHAVVRGGGGDDDNGAEACIYMQVDDPAADVPTEVRLFPSDAGTVLEPMFATLCAMAELNPDPSASDDPDSGGGFGFGGSGVVGADLSALLAAEPDRFADADDARSEGGG